MTNYCDASGNCKCSYFPDEKKCRFFVRAMVFSIAGDCIWRSLVSGACVGLEGIEVETICMSACAQEDARRKADKKLMGDACEMT